MAIDDRSNIERYGRDIANCEPLSDKEEAALGERIKLGDIQARNRLILANARFVFHVAHEYKHYGLPFGDLMGAGNIGLITAAERFDWTMGFRFISYAVWWIRQAILYYMAENTQAMRVPANWPKIVQSIEECRSAIEQKEGAFPSEEAVAKAAGISIARMHDVLTQSQRSLSIDAGGEVEGDGRSLLDTLVDTNQKAPDEIMARAGLKAEIDSALSTLSPREQKILQLTFGLEDEDPMTFEAIGQLLGLTRERVRQLHDKAIPKLRHSSRSNLKYYLDSTPEPAIERSQIEQGLKLALINKARGSTELAVWQGDKERRRNKRRGRSPKTQSSRLLEPLPLYSDLEDIRNWKRFKIASQEELEARVAEAEGDVALALYGRAHMLARRKVNRQVVYRVFRYLRRWGIDVKDEKNPFSTPRRRKH